MCWPILVTIALLATTACRYWSGDTPSAHGSAESSAVLDDGGDDWQRGRLPPVRADEVPLQGGELVTRIQAEPPSLNTIVDSDWIAGHVTDHRVYEALIDVDPYDHPNYRHRAGLAERWEVSPDELTYKFWLRRNVKWHDGAPFTARDVIATFDKVQDPTTKAMHIRAYTRDIESYKALDEYCVEFRLKRRYFMVMDGIFAEVPIQPAHVIAQLTGSQYNEAATNPLNRHPLGTGPFRFESWVSNQHIALLRNGQYWGRAPYLDRVVFRIIKDEIIALEMLGRQELDASDLYLAEQWARMDRRRFERHYRRSTFYESNYLWIGYNQKRHLFQDARVRRAMTQLIDRPGIMKSLRYGLAQPTTCHFYSESAACDPTLQPLPYDPVAASSLLDAAGWTVGQSETIRQSSGEKLAFSLMVPASAEESARMATLIKESMLRAGVEMRLQRVEWSAFVRRLRERDFDACILLWATGPRGDPTQIWHSSSIGGGSNYVGFNSPKADALIEAARSELDDNRRNRLYREFGKILYDEQPYTWMYTRPRLSLIHRRIHGVRTTLMGWRYEDWWVEGERKSGKVSK